MPISYGQSDIWYVDVYIDGSFGNPVNLGVNINTEARESFLLLVIKIYFTMPLLVNQG